MSNADAEHFPTRNKRTRVSAAAKIDMACTMTERFTNSPKGVRSATLNHATSSSSLRVLRATGTASPLPRETGRRRFGSSASFDGVLDTHRSPSPQINGTSSVSKSKDHLGSRTLPAARNSPTYSAVSISPSANSVSTVGHPLTLSASVSLGASSNTNPTASTSAVKNTNSSDLGGEDRAARFVNRLTLDLCASSSLFSDVCDAQIFQEKNEQQRPGEYASSTNASSSVTTSGKGPTTERESGQAAANTVKSPNGRRSNLKDLDMKAERGKSASSPPVTPGKEPVLSPKDGMMFSYFDVPVSELPSERKQLPLTRTGSERTTGLLRRTICVNTSTVSPVFDGVMPSETYDHDNQTPSSSGIDSTDGLTITSTSRGNSVAGAFSTTSSPMKTPRRLNGSVSSERSNSTPARRTNSTRRISKFFSRVFRRHRSVGRDDGEDGMSIPGDRSAEGTFSSSSPNGESVVEQCAVNSDDTELLEMGDAGIMATSCPSLAGRSSMTDSLALSSATPELHGTGQDVARGDRVRKSFTKLRNLGSRRSSGERSGTPGSDSQADLESNGAQYKRSAGTPEYNMPLSVIPGSPPNHGDSQFSQSGNDLRVQSQAFASSSSVVHALDPRVHDRQSDLHQYAPAASTMALKRQTLESQTYKQGTVTVLPGPNKAIHSSMVSLPASHTSRPSSTDTTSGGGRQGIHRAGDELHGRTMNSISPRSGSPKLISPKLRSPLASPPPARRVIDGVVIRQPLPHRNRQRVSKSMEEEGIAAALAEARGKMQKKEFDALSKMLSPDAKGRLIPKHSDWTVSMDNLEQQISPENTVVARQHGVVPRRPSAHDNKLKAQLSNTIIPLPPQSGLNSEETRNISRSLSSVIFKRKSSSIRSSYIQDSDSQHMVKGMSSESLNSPAKSLASGASDVPHKHQTIANPSETSSDVYFPSFGPSHLATTSSWFSAPPPIDFHPPNKPRSQMTDEDLRQHVVQTLLETELKYVSGLRTLVRDYFSQLKRNCLIDVTVVDEIFFQIPVINLCHKRFNQQLRERADKWHSKSMLGDVFLQSFSKGILSHAYTAYINHFMQVKDTLRLAMVQKPAFAKFLDQVSRDSEDKLTLSDLLIMPVQRIPRYVLILRDLIKHCPVDHPDHGLLLQALEAMCSLAEKMNRSEESTTNLELLKELEFCFNGLVPGLVAPHRQLVRKDRVSEVIGSQTKDRLMIMLSDVLLCATVRRRTGSKKGVGHASLMSSSDTNVRYKLMWRAMLKDISVFQTQDEIDLDIQAKQEIEMLEKDIILLSEISLKCEGLASPHQELYQSINSMIKSINDGIQERKLLRELATLTLTVDNKRGHASQHVVIFQSSEEKGNWLSNFRSAKEKLDEPMDGRESWHRAESDARSSVGESAALISGNHAPRFLNSIQMMKTRSGMQITCACPSVAPSHLTQAAIASKANGQLWVCASDGKVGQVCMVNTEKLSLRLTACITVCDSRITCIIAVPEYIPLDMQRTLAQQEQRKFLAEHHLSYDSESDNESCEERSVVESRSLDGIGLRSMIHHQRSPNTDQVNSLPSPVTEECNGAKTLERCPESGPAPAKDATLLPAKLQSVRSSPQLLHATFQHSVSDPAPTSGESRAHSSPVELADTDMQLLSGKTSPTHRAAALPDITTAADVGADDVTTPVPSSPATFLSEPRPKLTSALQSLAEGDSVRTLTRSSEPPHVTDISPSSSLNSNGVATRGESSSQCDSSVVSPADEQARGVLSAPSAVSSPAGASPVRQRLGSVHGEDGEDVFVAASLVSRVRLFNTLAESPSTTRGGNANHAAGDLVDSGIIPGDEGSASSTGSVSRSASDASCKSNNGTLQRGTDKGTVTVRSHSLSENRGRRVGRSFSHSVTQNPTPAQQRISAAHLLVSQQTNNLAGDAKKPMDHDPTMWLGTENGLLYIYRAGDSIRMRQRRTVLRFKSGVVRLCHTEVNVYVSFKDGHLIVFSRTHGGDWDTRDPTEIITNLPGSVVTCMAVVDGEVWCACRDRILIIGKGGSFIKKSIVVGSDPTAKVSYIACIGLCVYVAMETGGVLHCYNAYSQEMLFSMDTMASVAQMLTGCDTIIRQHKINCLRITALESFRGMVWAGTSAGVVLTVQNLPTITKATTAKDITETPHPQASYNGHTGPVRFITATERLNKIAVSKSASDGKNERPDSLSRHSTSDLPPSASSSVQSTPLHGVATPDKMSLDISRYVATTDVEALVITGGDGFEDFKASPIGDNDDFTQDDSSSHLLIWQTT